MQGNKSSGENLGRTNRPGQSQRPWFGLSPDSWRVVLIVLVAVAGLLEWGLHHYWATRAPTMQQWRDAGPKLVAEFKSRQRAGGELSKPLIVVTPSWAEPMARAVLGDEWMPLAHVARPDDSGFQSAVELSILDTRVSWPGWKEQWHWKLGPFELRGLVNMSAPTIFYEFVEELNAQAASVYTEKNGRKRRCSYAKRRVSNGDLHGHPTFPAQRFACVGGDWHFAGVTVIEDQDYRARRCIWAHPGEGETLVIEFLDVPLGKSLRGHGGLPYFRGRQSHGTPIEMEVRAGGQVLGSYVHRDGEGWTAFEMSTEGLAGQRSTVQFRIRSDKASHREFCFQADAR